MRDARETLQDAILERLGIPTTDADINAILTALSSAGLAVVPVEPTKQMIDAATMEVPTWDDHASKRKWRAMITEVRMSTLTPARLAEIRRFAASDYCRDTAAIDDLLAHIDALGPVGHQYNDFGACVRCGVMRVSEATTGSGSTETGKQPQGKSSGNPTVSDQQYIARLEAIIHWLDGLEGDWPDRQPGEGAFYWRRHMMRRFREARGQ